MTLQSLLTVSGEICLLGYGREGRAMLEYLRKHLPTVHIWVHDANAQLIPEEKWKNDHFVHFVVGESYLEDLGRYEVIIKSPGIPHQLLKGKTGQARIVSQTGIFLEMFSSQVVGVTGTKGKSTTSSLIYHFIQSAGKKAILLGNLGIPAISRVDDMDEETLVVFELSSHQLEDTYASPHIAVWLNIYQEHLDHYPSYEAYQQAKLNIARYQKKGDYLIFHAGHTLLRQMIAETKVAGTLVTYDSQPAHGVKVFIEDNILHANIEGKLYRIGNIESFSLRGTHNRLNLMAAVSAALLCHVAPETIENALTNFKALPHRLEYLGLIGGKHFYNDSIATIPEAAIQAMGAIGPVDVWIGGGYNRGINYQPIIQYLMEHPIPVVAVTGKAGEIIRDGLLEKGYRGQVIWESSFKDLIEAAVKLTPIGGTCLLSPAAASYDAFKNFEERGDTFKKIVREAFE